MQFLYYFSSNFAIFRCLISYLCKTKFHLLLITHFSVILLATHQSFARYALCAHRSPRAFSQGAKPPKPPFPYRCSTFWSHIIKITPLFGVTFQKMLHILEPLQNYQNICHLMVLHFLEPFLQKRSIYWRHLLKGAPKSGVPMLYPKGFRDFSLASTAFCPGYPKCVSGRRHY